MSDDDRTLGGLPSNRPPRDAPDDRPTVRIDAAMCDTRPHVAPRALTIEQAKELAADILTGSEGMRRAGPRGIEELAWFVARLDVDLDLKLDPRDVGAEPLMP